MYIHTDTKMNTEGNAFNFLCVNVHGLKYIFRKNCTCTVDSQKVKQILNLWSYFLKWKSLTNPTVDVFLTFKNYFL